MAGAIIRNSDYQSVDEYKAAIDRYFAERNEAFRKNAKRAGKRIWGTEVVEPFLRKQYLQRSKMAVGAMVLREKMALPYI
jgi:hypothetical protein